MEIGLAILRNRTLQITLENDSSQKQFSIRIYPAGGKRPNLIRTCYEFRESFGTLHLTPALEVKNAKGKTIFKTPYAWTVKFRRESKES